MTIKKTFFAGALFLLLVVPAVSHASGVSDWFSGLFGLTPAETETATALAATADWLDLKVNDSDGPVSAPDGTRVTLRWVVTNVTGVSNCHVGYPGESGHVSDAVAVFGSKSVTLYPSRSSVSYIELVCSRGTEQGHDVVPLSAQATQGNTQTTGGGGGAGSTSGGAGDTGTGSVGTGNTFNVSHTGAQVSGSGNGTGSIGGTGGGVGGAGSGATGSGGSSGGSGSGNSGSISGFVGGVAHAVGGYINTAQKGADRTMGRVTSVVNGILGTIGRAIGIGGGKGGTGGGGSGGKPSMPYDDKKPSKPKGK